MSDIGRAERIQLCIAKTILSIVLSLIPVIRFLLVMTANVVEFAAIAALLLGSMASICVYVLCYWVDR